MPSLLIGYYFFFPPSLYSKVFSFISESQTRSWGEIESVSRAYRYLEDGCQQDLLEPGWTERVKKPPFRFGLPGEWVWRTEEHSLGPGVVWNEFILDR
jgi:hypothetical protein